MKTETARKEDKDEENLMEEESTFVAIVPEKRYILFRIFFFNISNLSKCVSRKRTPLRRR